MKHNLNVMVCFIDFVLVCEMTYYNSNVDVFHCVPNNPEIVLIGSLARIWIASDSNPYFRN